MNHGQKAEKVGRSWDAGDREWEEGGWEVERCRGGAQGGISQPGRRVRSGQVLEKKLGMSRRGSPYPHRPSWKVRRGPAGGLRAGSRSLQNISADKFPEPIYGQYPLSQTAQNRGRIAQVTP